MSGAGNMAAIMEVNESMNKKFLQFEPAPRRGEPEVRHARRHCYDCHVAFNQKLLMRKLCVKLLGCLKSPASCWQDYGGFESTCVDVLQVTRRTPDYFL